MKIWIKVDSHEPNTACSTKNCGSGFRKKGRIRSEQQDLKSNFPLNKYWGWIVLGRNFFESVSGFFSHVYLRWYRGTHRTKWHLNIKMPPNEGTTTKAYILYPVFLDGKILIVLFPVMIGSWSGPSESGSATLAEETITRTNMAVTSANNLLMLLHLFSSSTNPWLRVSDPDRAMYYAKYYGKNYK